MSRTSTTPKTEEALREIARSLIAAGEHRQALKVRQTYLDSPESPGITSAETHCLFATAWRVTGSQMYLLNTLNVLERCLDTTYDHYATVRRELMLYYAARDEIRLSADEQKEMLALRKDPVQRITDMTAMAKMYVHTDNLDTARICIVRAGELLVDSPEIIGADAREITWWRFVIATIERRDDDACDSAQRLRDGWVIRRPSGEVVQITAESRSSRLKIIRRVGYPFGPAWRVFVVSAALRQY